MTAERLDDDQVGQRLAQVLETEANAIEVGDAWDAIASRLVEPDWSGARLGPVSATRSRRRVLGGVAAGHWCRGSDCGGSGSRLAPSGCDTGTGRPGDDERATLRRIDPDVGGVPDTGVAIELKARRRRDVHHHTGADADGLSGGRSGRLGGNVRHLTGTSREHSEDRGPASPR